MEFDIEIIGRALDFVMPYYEAAQPYLLDTVVGLVLGTAFMVGIFRAWRKTLTSLLVQWLCLALGFLVAYLLAPRVTNILLGIDAITGFFDEMPMGIVTQIMTAVLTLFIGIFAFALFGSILFAFARNRDWHLLLFPKWQLPKAAERIISGVFSFLNAYTYVFFFLAVMALPFFNVIEEGSLASTAVNANFIAGPVVDSIAEPIVELQETADTLERELNDIMTPSGSIDYEVAAEIINNDPERIAEIREVILEQLPAIPEEVIANVEGFITQSEDVTPEQVREFFLSQMQQMGQ